MDITRNFAIELILAGDENLTPNQNIEIFSDQTSKSYGHRPFQFFNAGSLGNMCPYSELIQPGTQHHRGMLKEHL